MTRVVLVALVLCLACPCEAHRFTRTGKITLEMAASEELAARETFASTVPFLESLVKDVTRLHTTLRKAGDVLLQVTTAVKPGGNATAKPAVVQAKTPLLKSASKDKPAKKKFDVAAAAEEMNKITKIQPMLGLVSGMYDAWKDKISDANKKEQEQKKACQEEIKDLEEKKKKFKNDANGTQVYDRIEKYWKKQREISHRQYHTALKMMHGGMEKFKTVMTAMKSALSGKKPSGAELTNLQRILPPEVVFLQVKVKELTIWSKGAIAVLRDARNPHGGMGKVSNL